MKKYKFGVSIGFKPEEVDAILNPEFIKQLDKVETSRKELKKLSRRILNMTKFIKQQNTWLAKTLNRKTELKFTKHSMQIDKGFELAKSWCPPKIREEDK